MKKMKKALLVILIVEYSLAILAQIFGLFSELVEAFTPIFFTERFGTRTFGV
jgi:type III secretory pathway component EscS